MTAYIQDIEGLIEKYGGIHQVNAIWRRVAGRDFFSDIQMQRLDGSAAAKSLNLAGNPVVLLGTAHTSRVSAQLAEAWVKRLRPVALVLERCPERFAYLSWPKALLMDQTAALRAVSIAGRGEVSAEEVRKIGPFDKAKSFSSDEAAQAVALDLWAEFELLNTERNQQVEEAAFHAWAQHGPSKQPRVLALSDMRESCIPLPTSEDGGGPDREALLASVPARDCHISGCIAACASIIRGPILVILGENHVAGVSLCLHEMYGAVPIAEDVLEDLAKAQSPSLEVAGGSAVNWRGAFLREPAIVETTNLYSRRRRTLQQSDLDAETALDEYIADVEGEEFFFKNLVKRGLAIELVPSGDRHYQDLISSLRTWVHQGGNPLALPEGTSAKPSKL